MIMRLPQLKTMGSSEGRMIPTDTSKENLRVGNLLDRGNKEEEKQKTSVVLYT